MKRKELIKLCLKQHAQDETDWGINNAPVDQWLYTLKAVICIILKRNRPEEGWTDAVYPIATWNFRSGVCYEYSPSASWEGLAVGHGWRNWWYFVYYDGYP